MNLFIGPESFVRAMGRVAAKLGSNVHPQMLRHACGFQLANQGTDTRTLQASRPSQHPAHRALHRNCRRRTSRTCGVTDNHRAMTSGDASGLVAGEDAWRVLQPL
jgi:hypothetical protein